MHRRKTRAVRVGDAVIGGGAPITVQSMTKTRTDDIELTLRQIEELAALGCEIIRCAVPARRTIPALEEIVGRSPIPVIADIHFDPSLALAAMDAGAHGVRVNPCTMSDAGLLADVYRRAAALGVKVRIGINSGSVRRRKGLEVIDDGGEDTAELMVSEALRQCEIAESHGCSSIVLSLKASSVSQTVEAYRRAAARCDYPFHIGVTAAGPPAESIVKSAIGIGSLLLDGIGDTVRVSMTGPPHREVEAACDILYALELRRREGPEIISCPTCGRCEIDLEGIVSEVQERLARSGAGGIKVAVMGCVVNGPGEAAEADIGIAGGRDFGVLFRGGRKICRAPADRIADMLVEEVMGMAQDGD